MLLFMNSSFHRPVEIPFVRYLRDTYPHAAEDLFAYRHLLTGRYVIARWVSRSAGVCTELLSGPTPRFTREDAISLGWSLSPQATRSYRDWARRQMKDFLEWRNRCDDEILADQELREYLRRQLPGLAKEDPLAMVRAVLPNAALEARRPSG
ncbi:MAG: hypothetical protein D6681_20255 [Calditrichaeota bacterium]|nr:MAG: hypothetical protein D6681_20255 [Calditrichota bacterium]